MSQTKKSSYDLVKIYLPSKVLNKSNSNEKFYLSGAFKTKKGSINSFNSIYEIFINKLAPLVIYKIKLGNFSSKFKVINLIKSDIYLFTKI